MYSAYKLNKQGDNIQPPFLIWNHSVVPCPVLSVASWSPYRFLRRQVRWAGIPISKNFPQFVVTHTIKGFGVVNKAKVDVFSGTLLLFWWSSVCCGEGNGNPLQCSCLENTVDRGAWWAAVYGVAQSQTWLKRLSSSSSRFLKLQWGIDLQLKEDLLLKGKLSTLQW